MRLSQICIDRPVFTTVMSLIIVLFGLIALPLLPNRELPDVDAPIVSVTTVYPGAAAEVVETSVTQPLEEGLNGIAGVKHLQSTSREQVSAINVEFDLDVDIESAANDVRDRVSRAMRHLPDEIDPPVVAKNDSDAGTVMWLALYGEGYEQVELTRIAESQIIDRIAKVPGVAAVMVGGERRFSMRVWIDNYRLGAQNLAISEVVAALQRENVDIPSGRVESTDTEFTVKSLGELSTAQEYADLLIGNVAGKPVRLGDVARVEAGPESERKIVRYNGQPAIGLGIVKQSKANALTVARGVKAEAERIVSDLGEGLVFEVAIDSSRFIDESIKDVRATILEAVLLVVLVIYVFLRSARATIVPAVAIPVSIIGTFAVLYFLGFTINTLTLMGVTLAIGLVVDDAIVVLENITRWVEAGTPPMEAARKGMDEIAFAVVAATISAVAVFLPLTFMRDMTGQLFREFAVTVATAILISGFVAITLAPMLSARVLRSGREEGRVKRAFGRVLEMATAGYARLLEPVLRRPGLAVAAVVLGIGWVALGGFLFVNAQEELMPDGDRAFLLIWTQAPDGSTVEYMDRYQRQAEDIVMEQVEEASGVLGVVALGIGTPGIVNEGIVLTQLSMPSERERSQKDIQSSLMSPLKGVAGIKAFAISPSPMRGFSSSPIEIVIQGDDIGELARMADEVEREAEATGVFRSIRSDLFLNKPQLEVSIDRERANDLGMSVRDIATTMQILLGGVDISTFKKDGETYNVMVQLEARYRDNPTSLQYLFVRGSGGLIPLSAVVETRMSTSPRAIPHFDRLRSVKITADLQKGFDQGYGLEKMHAIATSVLPATGGYRVQFSGEAEKFFESGSALVFAYLLAILIVFLVLSAQFESFVYPVAILVAVFLSFTGALVGLQVMDISLNLFSKIGIVMLVGLVTKNSILIVEFANQLRDRGLPLVDATLEASRTRFRPILMTAVATMVGILPIASGSGAGGSTRQGLGVAVISGMLFSTLFTFFIVPSTYVMLERMRGRRGEATATAAPTGPMVGAAPGAAASGAAHMRETGA